MLSKEMSLGQIQTQPRKKTIVRERAHKHLQIFIKLSKFLHTAAATEEIYYSDGFFEIIIFRNRSRSFSLYSASLSLEFKFHLIDFYLFINVNYNN